MDPVGEIQKVASMRRGDSGSIWRRGEDVFSRSSREEDDEEALRVGIDMPTIEVRFENLEAEAEVRVGSSGLPTILNSVVNTVEEAATSLHLLPSRKQTMPILHDISGIIKPRRLTLLLGPPGSGKTTFLLALAGRLDKDLKVIKGKVTYNGHEMTEFVPERTAAYISQHDLHIGEMTVRETLAFSARCQGVGSRFAVQAREGGEYQA
nr:unnamed protein product [Digitaria exilis]